ncbi:hypothetical protein BJ912DRAFT_929575 [Pholiota molesta]|nr:hypothetical protein BJ912DRAFT_929575 [Pholiota molesta]
MSRLLGTRGQLPPPLSVGGVYQQYQRQPYQAYPGQQQYPHSHPYAQQQPRPQPLASANNRYPISENEVDAYGGYVTEAAPAHGAEGALLNPFGGEEERRQSAVQEEPRRVLKVGVVIRVLWRMSDWVEDDVWHSLETGCC